MNQSDIDNNPTTKNEVIRIDLDAIIKARASRYYRYIPRFLIRKLERIICQDRLNTLLEVNAGLAGSDFCRGVINHLNISVDILGEQNLPADKRVVIVSNHPLGGLDGMIYIDFVARHYGVEPYFVVNDLLMAVTPLKDNFLPVNKLGKQNRQAAAALDTAMAGDRPIIIFPAGLCSRRAKNGEIADLRWQKMFVNKCKEFERPIIPAHFNGENSQFFYNFAKLRTAVGLKFNIEMVCLPSEIFKNENSRFSITIGKPISWETLRGGKEAQQTADEIKEIAYKLRPTDSH